MKPSVGLYVAGVGAAFAITLFDAMRNDSASALMKAAGWMYTKFGADRQALWIVTALIFFCSVAALIVFTYGPKTPKEAFVLGAGVLSLFNASIVSPLNPAKSVTGSTGFISEALAKAPENPSDFNEDFGPISDVWVFVDGPRQLRMPETRVVVFDASSNAPVLNTTVTTTFKLSLPVGHYFLQLDHTGYRSAIASIDVPPGGTAYHIKMDDVSYSSVKNLLGADNVDARQDQRLAEAIREAFNSCRLGQANPGPLAIDPAARERLAGNPDFARALCLRE